MAVMPLLIHDAPKPIQCIQTILNFTIPAQYILHDNKTLHYLEHALYKWENTKIVFEHY